MPYYTYKCQSCGDLTESFHKIADRMEPENVPCSQCNGSLKLSIGATARIDEVTAGRMKPPEDFRNFLQVLHKNTPGSKIRDRW